MKTDNLSYTPFNTEGCIYSGGGGTVENFSYLRIPT